MSAASVSVALSFMMQTSFAGSFEYPKAKKVDHTDDYHGTKVADPYRWLENPDAPESREWIEAQNKITFDFLGKIPAREKIKERLTELWNYERFGVPFKEGNRYFISRNDGLGFCGGPPRQQTGQAQGSLECVLKIVVTGVDRLVIVVTS